MEPVICFGQQPNGFLPKRFFYAKILKARKLQKDIGGSMVFFLHDSDHDPRETQTKIRSDEYKEGYATFNFRIDDRITRRWSPLAIKEFNPKSMDWIRKKVRDILPSDVFENLNGIKTTNVTRFCMEVYKRMGLLDEMEIVSSHYPGFRKKADLSEFGNGDGFYFDTEYEGRTVRAEICEGTLRLHHGGQHYTKIREVESGDLLKTPECISPGRDRRFHWMNSVIGCTHYVAGNEEMKYLSGIKGIKIIRREQISDPGFAWIPSR